MNIARSSRKLGQFRHYCRFHHQSDVHVKRKVLFPDVPPHFMALHFEGKFALVSVSPSFPTTQFFNTPHNCRRWVMSSPRPSPLRTSHEPQLPAFGRAHPEREGAVLSKSQP